MPQVESKRLQAELQRMGSQRADAPSEAPRAMDAAIILEMLPSISIRPGAWVRQAEGDDLNAVLRALDVQVRACRKRAVIEASVPLSESLQNLDLVTTLRSSACVFESDQVFGLLIRLEALLDPHSTRTKAN